jgi:signal peptidase I
MFTPKWKTEAKHLVKGARKFVQYKRDLLDENRIAEIDSRCSDLLDAVKSGDRIQTGEASKQLHSICENSLSHDKPINWFEENVEVMFVAIVIALGLRAYYLQPFRIPTGSMQPTLNGIVGTPLAKSQWPSFPQRMWEQVMRGRVYVHLEADRDRQVAVLPDGQFDLRNGQMMHFFSRSWLYFKDGSSMRLPAPITPCADIGLRRAMQSASRNNGVLTKGTVVCEGFIDSGDLVLVNKFAYHFRKPERGEVFVFDTLGIRGIEERSGEQAKGAHYIKRLCGVPGDTLSVDSPNLLVDGKIAQEPGIQRVIHGKGPYAINPNGYHLASPEPDHNGRQLFQYIAKPDDTLTLRNQAPQGLREYAALGDNTGNSLDSRYWGTVKEYNLVGPALFSLWPFTTGHWGFIR